MPKGMFSQCLCVLLRKPISLEQLEASLARFDIRSRKDKATDWMMGGPSLLLAYRLEVNGMVDVDIIDRVWPDTMGDPQGDPTLFGAWAMGSFGPSTFPGSLERAMQQSWRWTEGRTIPSEHRAFIRVRVSYVFGTDRNAPVLPQDYQPAHELEFLNQIVSELLELPEAICYFNPSGEVVADRESVRQTMSFSRDHQIPALDLWSNIRLFQASPTWDLMDTVGNGQLDLPDFEACVYNPIASPQDVDPFLRNMTLYLKEQGNIVLEGDTIDGPGGNWKVQLSNTSTCVPPRSVIRLIPEDAPPLPDFLSQPQSSSS